MQPFTLDPTAGGPDRSVLDELVTAFRQLDPADASRSSDDARRQWEAACNRLGHYAVRLTEPGIDEPS